MYVGADDGARGTQLARRQRVPRRIAPYRPKATGENVVVVVVVVVVARGTRFTRWVTGENCPTTTTSTTTTTSGLRYGAIQAPGNALSSGAAG